MAHQGAPGLGPLEHGDTGGAGGGDWYGYRCGLQAYGPAQAVVHPYCLIPLD